MFSVKLQQKTVIFISKTLAISPKKQRGPGILNFRELGPTSDVCSTKCDELLRDTENDYWKTFVVFIKESEPNEN